MVFGTEISGLNTENRGGLNIETLSLYKCTVFFPGLWNGGLRIEVVLISRWSLGKVPL